MYAALCRIQDLGRKHPVLSVVFIIIFAVWLLLLPFFLSGCVARRTYVLPAQSAKTDVDFEQVVTLRLPLVNQPDGAMIFCTSSDAASRISQGLMVYALMVYAKKLDDSHVRVRDIDGEERNLEMPNDESPRGLGTVWPEKTARTCGIAPTSPIGSYAMVMWAEFTLFMKRTGPSEVSYTVGLADSTLRLHYPLTPPDRALLHKNAVPYEIVNLLF
ncbi:MAG: hypothetical protein WC551_01160 [Patescibacteria group bacterium]